MFNDGMILILLQLINFDFNHIREYNLKDNISVDKFLLVELLKLNYVYLVLNE